MRFAHKILGFLRAVWRHLRARRPIVAIIEIVLALLLLAFLWTQATHWVVAIAALAVGMYAVRRKWPRVRMFTYFHTRRMVLPLALLIVGVGGQFVVDGAGLGAQPASTFAMLVGGVAAVGALSIVAAIFEGKIMKDLYDLVPAEQQAGLREFFAGSAGVGQRVDLSGFDQEEVIAELRQRVVGQDAAVAGVVHAIFRSARHPRPDRPLASILLAGKSGMGKTELANAVSDVLFNGRIFKVDFEQYPDRQALWTLLGTPRGYQDNSKGGTLTEALQTLGTGVLLLDEFGRGAKELQEAMMNLMDKGRVTETSTGVEVSARGFVIIATSNTAQDEITKLVAVERDPGELARKVRGALRKAGIADAVVNRFTSVYPFGDLSREDVARVVASMAQKVAVQERVEVEAIEAGVFTDLVRQQEVGADAGLRELYRVVDRLLADKLADARDAGAKHVAIRVRNGEVQVLPAATNGGAE